MSDKKRYVVTFNDPDIKVYDAGQVLGIDGERSIDGVAMLSSDAPLLEEKVYTFEGLGTAALSATDQEIEYIRNNPNVAEVVEDFEVVALDTENGELDTLTDAQSEEQISTNAYYQAYADALREFRDRLNEFADSLVPSSDDGSRTTPSLTPAPGAPLPKFPLPIPFPKPPILLPKQPLPWNIKMVKAEKAWARAYYGAGIKVAVLDTGIASHPDLVVYGGASFVPGVGSYNDGHGHGTHCAGIVGARHNLIGVVGVAPQCHLYGVKVLNDAGSGQLSWILAGMAWARQNGMRVISMSLGSNQNPVLAYTQAVSQCLAAGVVVVAAAGNSFGTSYPFVGAPANSPGVIAVGAVNSAGVIAPFSSRGGVGNQVTISAPGVSVNSTHLANGYKSMSGTSMACPHVAGGVALVRRRFPSWTPAQVRARLVTTAQDLGFPGNDITYGAGLLDCERATL